MRKTSPKSVPTAYQMSLFGLEDFLAKTFQWSGKEKDYTENELACFLSLFGSSENEVTINRGQALLLCKSTFQVAAFLPLHRWLIYAVPKIRHPFVKRLCQRQSADQKMLRESFPLAEAGILPLFYVNWPHWGMVLNTHLLIPKTTECPKTESACILSEILQDEVPEKYFLSEDQAQKLLNRLLEVRREAESITQEAFHQLSLLEQED